MNKKITSIIILIIVMIICFTACNYRQDGQKETSVTELSKPEDLLMLANGGKFKLVNDIDCRGLKFKSPILNEKDVNIEGDGYVIKNLTLISDNNFYGLIGYTNGSVDISKLGMENVTVCANKTSHSDSLCVGTFVGYTYEPAQFSECFASGTIQVSIEHDKNYIGGLVGLASRFTSQNCLSNLDISIGYESATFSNAKVYAGGFLGYGGGSSNNYYSRAIELSNCINLSSISANTALNFGLNVESYVGGLVGYVGSLVATNCLSAPKYLFAEANRKNDVTIGGVTIVKSSKIGGIAGYAGYDNSCSKIYYCVYDNGELTQEERNDICSVYEKLNGSTIGTAVNLEKTIMLSESFLLGEYTFIDKTDNEMTTHISLSQDIWRIDNNELTDFRAPSLRVFD